SAFNSSEDAVSRFNKPEFSYDDDDSKRRKVTATAKDVKVARSPGVKQITLPENMSYQEGAAWLIRKDEEEDKEVAIHHEIDCFPLDGCVAFRDALEEIYGFVASIDTPGGWFSPDQPPKMIGI